MRDMEARSLRLEVEDTNESTPFLTSTGVRVTELRIENEGVELGGTDGAGWRRMLPRGGARKVEIALGGLLFESPAERRYRELAMTGSDASFRIDLEDGHALQGRFVVKAFTMERSKGEEPSFSLRLASSGRVTLN